MYRRKKTPRKKARVTHTKRKIKRKPQRRKPMAKRKSAWDKPEKEDVADSDEQDKGARDEGQEDEFDTAEGGEQTTDQHNEGETQEAGSEAGEVPVQTETAPSDQGAYKLDSIEVAIKGTVYRRGDRVTLTPEELEQFQKAGVRILPAD